MRNHNLFTRAPPETSAPSPVRRTQTARLRRAVGYNATCGREPEEAGAEQPAGKKARMGAMGDKEFEDAVEEALERVRAYRLPTDSVSRVSCKKKWYARTPNPRYSVVAVDCGIKLNIVRKLNQFGCNVTVVPYDTPAVTILSFKPDGLFLSNGPGDPEDVRPVIDLVRALRGRLPIFGICLGHQMIALACGARTFKMKFGHRGGNHPVRELATGKIEITSQNHSFAVDEGSLQGTGLILTHQNLLDGTAEGVACLPDKLFSVQYHPESAPGPQDSTYLFKRFIDLMEGEKKHA